MVTRVARAYGDPERDERVMREAGEIITGGGLVAIPTETVYGLAGNALDPRASAKIYAAKGRPSDNPLIVHIARLEDMAYLVKDIPDNAYRLAESFWPGPLTMIMKKSDRVPYETTGGLDTVAVRFPSDPIADEFILASGGYIAAPSANVSGRPSCTTAMHCIEDLSGRIDMIIDGGEVGIGLESTIVDLTGRIPCLLRPGYIGPEGLAKIIGELDIDPTVKGIASKDLKPKAPGMKYRHYAPRGELTLVKGSPDAVTDRINRMTEELEKKSRNVAVIASEENAAAYTCRDVYRIGGIGDEEGIAHRLFAVLRELDDRDTEYIFSECFDTPVLGLAIMNRLIKAAGGRIIDLTEE